MKEIRYEIVTRIELIFVICSSRTFLPRAISHLIINLGWRTRMSQTTVTQNESAERFESLFEHRFEIRLNQMKKRFLLPRVIPAREKNPSSGSHYHSINIWMLINGIACLVHKNINDMTLKLFLDGIINQRIEMCLVLGLSNLRSSEFSFPRLSSREVLALLSWEKKSLARGWWCTKGKGKVNRCFSWSAVY